MLFTNQPLCKHLENRENYLVFTQLFVSIVKYRFDGMFPKTQCVVTRIQRRFLQRPVDYGAFGLKTLKFITDKSCPYSITTLRREPPAYFNNHRHHFRNRRRPSAKITQNKNQHRPDWLLVER